MVFLAVHIGSAIIDGYVPLQWVDAVVPFVSDYHPVWLGLGAIAFDLLIAVIVTSLLRARLSQRVWRTVHVASYALWPIAMIHGLGIGGSDSRLTWVIALNGVCAAAVAASVTRRLLVRHPDTKARRARGRRPVTALDNPLDTAFATVFQPASEPVAQPDGRHPFNALLDTGPIPIVSPTAVESQRLFAAAPQEWITADLDAHLARFGPLPLADYPSGAGKRLLVEKVARAGLRGRGGAGYPMAEKMMLISESRRGAIVLANGCEGDPSSAKDRALLRRAPHLVLDGIALAAHALGAREAVLALHTGSPLTAVLANALHGAGAGPGPGGAGRDAARLRGEREHRAGQHAEHRRSAPDRRADLEQGRPRPSDAGVQRGDPRAPRPDRPLRRRLVPRALAPPHSPGTTLVTVSGAVNRPGVHEVELGLPMSDVLELAGGETEPLRAVLIGGLGGSWLPIADAIELPLAHETCADVGHRAGRGRAGRAARAGVRDRRDRRRAALPRRRGRGPVRAVPLRAARDRHGLRRAGHGRRRPRPAAPAAAAAGRDPWPRRLLAPRRGRPARRDRAAHLRRRRGRARGGQAVRRDRPRPLDPAGAPAMRLRVDPINCHAHGVCAELLPELITLDEWGYPILANDELPPELAKEARKAVQSCPALALSLRKD